MVRLGRLREVEVHRTGTDTHQTAGMRFPGGIDMEGESFVEVDFRSGTPIGRYKTGESGPVLEHPLKLGWAWEARDRPDVMELCRKGLDIVPAVVASRDAMGFVG